MGSLLLRDASVETWSSPAKSRGISMLHRTKTITEAKAPALHRCAHGAAAPCMHAGQQSACMHALPSCACRDSQVCVHVCLPRSSVTTAAHAAHIEEEKNLMKICQKPSHERTEEEVK
jgi:hypothetical protein